MAQSRATPLTPQRRCLALYGSRIDLSPRLTPTKNIGLSNFDDISLAFCHLKAFRVSHYIYKIAIMSKLIRQL